MPAIFEFYLSFGVLSGLISCTADIRAIGFGTIHLKKYLMADLMAVTHLIN